MVKKTLPLFIAVFLCAAITFAQNSGDNTRLRDKEKAEAFFEESVTSNLDKGLEKIDLARLFRVMGRMDKINERLQYRSDFLHNSKFEQHAGITLNRMNKELQSKLQTVHFASDGDSGYYYYNKGEYSKAAQFFERHLQQNPKDVKAHLQVGYIYYGQKKYSQALKHFDAAGRYATDPKDKDAAKSASFIIREQMAGTSARSFDIYFYNYYDSFQENYIAYLVMHLNFRLGKGLYAGPYLDVSTDTRSTKEVIYNDRYIEIGLFMRFHILDNLFFEGRIGYARQLDKDSNKINLKPMLIYYNRFGDAKVYVSKNSSASKTSLYMDIYYALMYDYKYKNAFLQATMYQVIRFHTGGYSYIENYLVETAQFDSRRLDYNNYFEVGTGIRFKPNLPVFPVFFLEPTYKVYFYGDRKNSFQIKAGFWFILRTKI